MRATRSTAGWSFASTSARSPERPDSASPRRSGPTWNRRHDIRSGPERTSLHLALSAAVAEITGAYFDEHQPAQPALAVARDEALQEALWAASLRWGGLGAAHMRP